MDTTVPLTWHERSTTYMDRIQTVLEATASVEIGDEHEVWFTAKIVSVPEHGVTVWITQATGVTTDTSSTFTADSIGQAKHTVRTEFTRWLAVMDRLNETMAASLPSRFTIRLYGPDWSVVSYLPSFTAATVEAAWRMVEQKIGVLRVVGDDRLTCDDGACSFHFTVEAEEAAA